MHVHNMPEVCLCNTASPSDTKRSFDTPKIHRIFGCRHFRNPKHIISATNNVILINTGKTPTTLGAYATTPKANKGTSKLPHCHFLEKFHKNIFYGNCTSMGVYRYSLLLFDVSTRYC